MTKKTLKHRLDLTKEMKSIRDVIVKGDDGETILIKTLIVNYCENFTSQKPGVSGHKENVQAFDIGQEIDQTKGDYIDLDKEGIDFLMGMVQNSQAPGLFKVRMTEAIESAEEVEYKPKEEPKKKKD